MGFKILLILSVIFLSSCSTFLQRRSCNSTDWYSHGFGIGQRGAHLDRDSHLIKCRQVEAEVNEAEVLRGHQEGLAQYCSPERANNVGRRGLKLDISICSEETISDLIESHRKGLEFYCTTINAFRLGSEGKSYNRVCGEFDEEAFLAEYRRGRKIYLQNQISERERWILSIDRQLISLESDRAQLTNQLMSLSARPNYTVTTEREYDPRTKTYKEVVKAQESDQQRREREGLERRISDITSQMSRARQDQMSYREQIHRMNQELRSLD